MDLVGYILSVLLMLALVVTSTFLVIYVLSRRTLRFITKPVVNLLNKK